MKIQAKHLNKVIELNLTIPKKEFIYLSLLEEIGELACELAIASSYKKRKPSVDGVLGESVDVIICLLSYLYYGVETSFDNDLNMEEYCLITPTTEIEQFVNHISIKNFVGRPAILEFPLKVFVEHGGTEELLNQLLESKIAKWEKNTNA